MTAVLFICTGNICRSPTAEGVFRELLIEQGLEESIGVDSAGMISYHVGEAPDHRAVATAGEHAIDISRQRARQINKSDLARFDYIIGMDQGHLDQLHALVPPNLHHKVHLLMSFAEQAPDSNVPDPYYGSMSDFVKAFEYIEMGCRALLTHLTLRQ